MLTGYVLRGAIQTLMSSWPVAAVAVQLWFDLRLWACELRALVLPTGSPSPAAGGLLLDVVLVPSGRASLAEKRLVRAAFTILLLPCANLILALYLLLSSPWRGITAWYYLAALLASRRHGVYAGWVPIFATPR